MQHTLTNIPPNTRIKKARIIKPDLLRFALDLQLQHAQQADRSTRLQKGQVFTPPEVSRFMASLVTPIPKTLRLLDPGAGVGILTAALCERITRYRSSRQVEIHLFETDPLLIPPLTEVLEHCKNVLAESGHQLIAKIHQQDFILSHTGTFDQTTLFGESPTPELFDAVIMNPPYFKLAGESPHAKALPAIVHGQPNMYALFMATAAMLLKKNGQMVAITPRSFCNGPYFRTFRKWLFARMTLERVHLFESRKHVFKEAGILQESLITLTRKTFSQREPVVVSYSFGRETLANPSRINLPSLKIFDHSANDLILRIPESELDASVLEVLDDWDDTFCTLGLRVSTGPVVSFRATDYLMATLIGKDAVPLLLVSSVQRFATVWPPTKNGKPTAFRVSEQSRPLLLPARNYVLLRRFSAKEEHRRLTASCFLRSHFPHSLVAIENHINYVCHSRRELSDDEVFGLAALFNSKLLDRYFRSISGNTQVNATELRSLKLPSMAQTRAIGHRVRRLKAFSPEATEPVILDLLNIPPRLAKQLLRHPY